MSRLTMPRSLASRPEIALGGRALYERERHGRVTRSGLEAGLATPLTLPVNAPAINQRCRPGRISIAGDDPETPARLTCPVPCHGLDWR